MALCIEEANEKYREGDESPLLDREYDFFMDKTQHLRSTDTVGTSKIFNLFPEYKEVEMLTTDKLLFNTAACEYRAWDTETNEMLNNVLLAGSLLLVPEDVPDPETDARVNGVWYREFPRDSGFVIMTHTGRCTQDGTKVFTGDVLQWQCLGTTYTAVVHYSREYCAYLAGTTALALAVNKLNAHSAKVIGNVFTKPELMSKIGANCLEGSVLTATESEQGNWERIDA